MRGTAAWLGAGFALSLLVPLAIAGGTYLWLRTSLPQSEGEITLEGLSAPVEVVRDPHGIPHLYARTLEDLCFAMGFVHAQDRLWQMEIQRRTGAGRLAEVFGAPTLEVDRFLRTIGMYRIAERNWERFDAAAKAAFRAYAAGVNAFIESHGGALPPEFILFGVEPEPWRPADSLVLVKLMAWDLGGTWHDDLLRARLAERLHPERAAELWPPYPADAPVVLPEFPGPHEAPAQEHLSQEPRAAERRALGSNNWAVSGARSESGAPLLANDPHLPLTVPSQWYLAHLSAPGLEVVGATLPGLPLPVLGRAERIAWGFTNTNPDVQDLFIERVDPEDPERYLTPDGWAPFTTRNEVIRVRGEDEVALTVRETRHGPVLSDVLGEAAEFAGPGHVLALAWTALAEDDLTAQAGFKIAQSRNWMEFTAALRDFHAPQQNVVYADVEGNIGFYSPGRVPIRKSGDGWMPVPGWDGESDWTGFVPFEALPHGFNPASGRIVSANNKVGGEDYPYFITRDWAPPYRARRIEALLDSRARHTPSSFAAIQNDVRSSMAADLLPLMTGLVEAREGRTAEVLSRLERWDHVMARERPEPLVFSAWQRELVREIFADELGDLFGRFWALRPLLLEQALTKTKAWCDDMHTEPAETCAEQVTEALERALDFLGESYGSDPDRWRWGEAHYARMAHPRLSRVPFLGALFAVELPNDGGEHTVNAAGFEIDDPKEPFVQRHGPGYRAIYDLGDPRGSLFMQNLGQSGNPLSPHFRDLAKAWRDGAYLSIATERSEIEARGVLVLRPKAPEKGTTAPPPAG